MQDRTLTIVAEDGKETVCDILFTYHYDENNKDYVVFQVRNSGEVSAAVYNPVANGEGSLERVETEEEWAMLEELLDDYANSLDDMEGGCSGSCASCGGCGGSCDDGECDCNR